MNPSTRFDRHTVTSAAPGRLQRAMHGALLAAGLLAGLLAGAAAMAQASESPASASEGFSAGLSAHGRTTVADIGLPAYPGALPYREPGNDAAGASLGLWGGSLGVQLHVLKLRSGDPVETVARFYRSALARHGEVLDCLAMTAEERRAPPPAEHNADKRLSCGSDRPKAGGRLFKAGTPSRFRLVALEPVDGGTQIQLVRLAFRGE